MNPTFDFSLVWHWLLAYGIALARPTAMLSLHPVFTRVPLTGLLRGAVATALALPTIAKLASSPSLPQSAIGFMILAIKEAVIGGVLGLLLGAPFWALDIAGDILDAQRGATQGRLNDPAGFADVSISGTLLVVTGVTLFVLTGGLETLADLLYRSWALWPPLGGLPTLDDRTPLLVLGMLDRITTQGILIAIPVVIAMLIADAALLVVARIAPQLRIDDLALSARNVVFYIVMPLYGLFLVTYIRRDVGDMPALLDMMRAATKGAP